MIWFGFVCSAARIVALIAHHTPGLAPGRSPEFSARGTDAWTRPLHARLVFNETTSLQQNLTLSGFAEETKMAFENGTSPRGYLPFSQPAAFIIDSSGNSYSLRCSYS